MISNCYAHTVIAVERGEQGTRQSQWKEYRLRWVLSLEKDFGINVHEIWLEAVRGSGSAKWNLRYADTSEGSISQWSLVSNQRRKNVNRKWKQEEKAKQSAWPGQGPKVK